MYMARPTPPQCARYQNILKESGDITKGKSDLYYGALFAFSSGKLLVLTRVPRRISIRPTVHIFANSEHCLAVQRFSNVSCWLRGFVSSWLFPSHWCSVTSGSR